MAPTWLGGMASKLSWVSPGQTVFKFIWSSFSTAWSISSVYKVHLQQFSMLASHSNGIFKFISHGNNLPVQNHFCKSSSQAPESAPVIYITIGGNLPASHMLQKD